MKKVIFSAIILFVSLASMANSIVIIPIGAVKLNEKCYIVAKTDTGNVAVLTECMSKFIYPEIYRVATEVNTYQYTSKDGSIVRFKLEAK